MKWDRFAIVLLLLSIACLVFSSPASATSPQIVSFPTNVNLDSSFSVTATMSGLTKDNIYRLRVVFAKTGTTSYFGSTFNGTDWYNGTPSPIVYANFLTISADDAGSWNGTIQAKVAKDDPNFSGSGGNYDFKVGRYTQNGSSATWSDPVQITVNAPLTATPTLVPTSTPKVLPTSKPQATNTVIPTQVEKNSPNIAQEEGDDREDFSPTIPVATVDGVLGSSTSASPTSVVKLIKKQLVAADKVRVFPFLLAGFGIMLVGSGVISFLLLKKKITSPPLE